MVTYHLVCRPVGEPVVRRLPPIGEVALRSATSLALVALLLVIVVAAAVQLSRAAAL